jgi:hypothetical protein
MDPVAEHANSEKPARRNQQTARVAAILFVATVLLWLPLTSSPTQELIAGLLAVPPRRGSRPWRHRRRTRLTPAAPLRMLVYSGCSSSR